MGSWNKASEVTLTLGKSKEIAVWIEKFDKHQLHVWGNLTIPHTPEQVWQVLTDYEALPDFIPHLVKSQRIPTSESRLRLEQVGAKSLLNFCFSARAVLDLNEQFPHQIQFQIVEGDFHALSGECRLERETYFDGILTNLHYSIQIVPKLIIPLVLLEKLIRSYLPSNLLKIRQRVSELFREKPPNFADN